MPVWEIAVVGAVMEMGADADHSSHNGAVKRIGVVINHLKGR